MITMNRKNKTNTKREAPIGIRFRPDLRKLIKKVAKEEGRSAPNVVVYIVDQYFSSTNGKLLKQTEIMSTNDTNVIVSSPQKVA